MRFSFLVDFNLYRRLVLKFVIGALGLHSTDYFRKRLDKLFFICGKRELL